VLEKWRTNEEQDEKLDASQFRLLASFDAEQVGRLWPELKACVKDEQPVDKAPVQMTLTGDTEPGEHILHKPHQFEQQTIGLDWEQLRLMRFERHFHSLGRLLKDILVGIVLLTIAIIVFKIHRRLPDDVATDVFDWSAIPEDLDIDIDL
jgi:hypothetical protein